MFFDVQVLEKKKIHFDHVFAPGAISPLDEGINQVGDLQAAGVAEMVDPHGVREIRVRGTVQGKMEVLCARCLEPVVVTVSGPIDLFYRPMAQIARNEEVEITQAETEIGFYEGAGLDLADVVREQVMIELPMRSVCREDCRGICPLCGANRNREACGCQETFSDTRWQALNKWKV